jgi:hypothetical protein
MKKTFPGHFVPAEDDIRLLWENCIFVLDTNILLNFYRYSDSTREEFLRVLHALEERLWLPHRVAQEYFENRLTVIAQQEKAYDETLKTIQTLQADLSNARQHPFLSDKLMQKLTKVLEEVSGELDKTKTTHVKRTSSDDIQKKIGDLFAGRVGPSLSDEQLEAICKEGEERYKKKVPPGYKDDIKDDGVASPHAAHRKFGDFIIWSQILARAIESKKDVIFINDDKKEDWYLIFKGKTLGPRPELVQEFLSQTKQSIYLYQADRFLELAAEHLKQKVTPESMDEIREIRDIRVRDLDRQAELARRHDEKLSLREERRFREEIRLREEEAMLRSRLSDSRERLESLRARVDYHRKNVLQLEHGQAIYQEKLDRSHGEDHESLEGYMELQRHRAAAEAELTEARNVVVK